jgi:zinc transport system permease protein
MMEIWYHLVELLPFDWVSFDFMKNALLAVIIVTPCFGLIGTMVIGNRMAFFSDMIGHSALAGIGIGVILGFGDLRPVLIIFAVILSVIINIVLKITKSSTDTVIGVFTATTIALGVVLLSRGGSFNKYTVYLIGDTLSISPQEIFSLLVMFIIVLVFWMVFAGYLSLLSVEPSLAYGRALSPFVMRTLFSALVAIVIILSIKWVGILIINSLLILPAAAARIISPSLKKYFLTAVLISIVSGITGLLLSFYTGGACGASIVLCSVVVYILVVVMKKMKLTH